MTDGEDIVTDPQEDSLLGDVGVPDAPTSDVPEPDGLAPDAEADGSGECCPSSVWPCVHGQQRLRVSVVYGDGSGWRVLQALRCGRSEGWACKTVSGSDADPTEVCAPLYNKPVPL